MAARGVHFALTADEEARLVDVPDADDEHFIEVLSEIEEQWDRDWLVETDKAWDAIHRCLTDGTLSYGHEPLEKCVLGTGHIYEGDDYIVNFLEAAEVKEVAEAIQDIDREWMRSKYNAIDPADYGQPRSEEDFEYTWSNFVDLRAFFQKAAKHNRAVVFSADQ
jgi:hypothetical protein